MATQHDRPPTEPQGRMRPTRPATLVVAVLTTAALGWLLIDNCYGELPKLSWLPTTTMFGLAVVEAVAAWQTKARIERRAGAPPVQPLLVARYVALAKASALAGALFGGFYGGLAVWLLAQRTVLRSAGEDLSSAIAGSVGAFALLAAGLWLERACRVPPPPGGDAAPGGRAGSMPRDHRNGSGSDH